MLTSCLYRTQRWGQCVYQGCLTRGDSCGGQRRLGQLFLTLILFAYPEWEGNEPLSRSLESHPHVPVQPKPKPGSHVMAPLGLPPGVGPVCAEMHESPGQGWIRRHLLLVEGGGLIRAVYWLRALNVPRSEMTSWVTPGAWRSPSHHHPAQSLRTNLEATSVT